MLFVGQRERENVKKKKEEVEISRKRKSISIMISEARRSDKEGVQLESMVEQLKKYEL